MKDSKDNDLIAGCKLKSTKYNRNKVICLGFIKGWILLIQDTPGAYPWLVSESDMLTSQWEVYEYPDDENQS